jgi:ariadne-1
MSSYSDTMEESDYEDDSYQDEEDMFFDPIVPDSKVRKIFEVEYDSLSPVDILNTQYKEISHVCSILGCSNENAAILLRYFRWNKERLIENFMENEVKVMRNAGVRMETHTSTLVKKSGFICDICCNDDKNLEAFSLSCFHYFCKFCYTQYLTQKIVQEGESRHITCPAECDLIVDGESVALLVESITLKK